MASGVVASDGEYSVLPSGVYFGFCHCDRQHSRGFSLGRTCTRLRWSTLLPRGSCRFAERPTDCITGNLQDARVHGVDVIVYCGPPQRSVRFRIFYIYWLYSLKIGWVFPAASFACAWAWVSVSSLNEAVMVLVHPMMAGVRACVSVRQKVSNTDYFGLQSTLLHVTFSHW